MAGHVLPEAKLAPCCTSVEFQPAPISLFLGNRDTDSHGPFTWPALCIKNTRSAVTQHPAHYVGRKDAIPNSFLELIESFHFPRRALWDRAAEQKGCTTKQFSSDDKALSG